MTWLSIAALKALFGGALKRLSAAFTWATASTARMLTIALALALLVALWAYHGWSREEARHKADNAAALARDKINLASIATLQAALTRQNAAVQALGDASAAKQKASQAIVDKALADGRTAEQAAQRIEAEAKVWPKDGKSCRTGAAVLDAKEQL